MTKNERNNERNEVTPEEAAYLDWRADLWSDPEYRAIYEEEAAKSQLWLQLAEARRATGLTQKQLAERMGVSQAQVARIEKEGYDAYTLTTLRRYVEALGDGFALEVSIHRNERHSKAELVAQ